LHETVGSTCFASFNQCQGALLVSIFAFLTLRQSNLTLNLLVDVFGKCFPMVIEGLTSRGRQKLKSPPSRLCLLFAESKNLLCKQKQSGGVWFFLHFQLVIIAEARLHCLLLAYMWLLVISKPGKSEEYGNVIPGKSDILVGNFS